MKDEISEPAKNLIRGLLNVDPVKRFSVTQVLQHEWRALGMPFMELRQPAQLGLFFVFSGAC